MATKTCECVLQHQIFHAISKIIEEYIVKHCFWPTLFLEVSHKIQIYHTVLWKEMCYIYLKFFWGLLLCFSLWNLWRIQLFFSQLWKDKIGCSVNAEKVLKKKENWRYFFMIQQELNCGPPARKQRFISDFGTEQMRVGWTSHTVETCSSCGWQCVKLEWIRWPSSPRLILSPKMVR